MDGAKFADSRGFTAVWTPERHFHPFGGIYPNPSVCGAALAAVTERIQIRAGSVVLPLQNPLRVAEEWSVVDNLSGGRIGISFASGWQPNDFVLAPEAYASRKERMLRGIETVRKLWRGETVVLKNGAGVDVNVGIHPCPVQPELPFWITAAGTPETFRIAGELGANLLTHLLGQNIQQLAENIRAYRDARRTHGHAGEGHVTLMIHTYLGTSLDSVREKVRIPFSNYLVQAVDLGRGSSKENPTQEDREAIIEHAFNRYFENSGLMGTVASCLATIEKLKEIEVDEVACLIDFGVDYESMMASLELVDQLRIASNPATPELPEEETILRFQPTHFQCTPSMAAMFLNDPRTKDLLVPMQRLFLGGELLPASTVHELHSITSAQLYNMYGPTETTIWSAVYKITGNIETSVPIGRPIANTEIYILDQSLNPLPAGIPGELYIGGAGVARAYLGRPELTAERFIPNSFGHKLGTRLYRTGDIARWQHDGNLEFLGRIDQQVKLLGHRIELGEIENALAMLSDVHQCAVVLREDRPSERRLVAYVVPEPGKIPGRDELKSYLKARLPEYMIPSMYVSLPEMPQTPNGKIDRKALPAPEEQTDIAGGTAPRNPTEEMLWGMWVETLNINHAGIHDDFFDLGGQSLLAMQVVARVRNIFQIDLPLRALFENRTIAGLAEYINRTRDQQHVALPPLGHAARETDPPLSYAQQRLWFLDQLEAHSAAYNMSFGCCLSGELDTEILYISLNEIVRRHEVLRTSFPAINGKPTQRISRDLTLPIDEVDLSSLPREEREKEIQLLIRAESAVGFDLAQGPLLRVKLVRSAERKHVLLLTMHHIVGDGWSSGIMLREFSQLYAAYIQGNGSPLPELKLQYTDFAIWQRDWLQGQLLAGQTSYWRQQLAETEPLELPLDYTRPAIESNAGAMLPWTLPDELSTELRTLTRKEGVTLFMTLLAGFQLLLSRYSGQNDISIGTPIAGRRWLETEDLVGFFVNTLVLRTQLDDDFSFVELLHRVRQITLDAYQHHDVPFEKLVEELHPERDLSRSPLFQVMLAFENVLQNKMDLPGLTLTQIEVGSGLAKFDLLLRVDDVGSTVQGALIYRTELFAESTMQRLLTHFTNLLADAVAHSQKPIRELALLSSAEQQQLLEWNQTRREYPFYCMHELFEAQARQVPTATAIEDRGEYWSYRDLNCRANQLARYLKRSGIGPEMRVGICMRRGAEMVIGLLGILKAGAAYVPVDPSYPEERLRFMLDDAQAQVLLTEGGLRKLFPDNQVLKICVDEEAFEIAQEDGSDLGVKLDPRNLAYVIYTSGSTGKPKGAAIMHRAASVLMHWAREVFTNEELRGVLASTSICFDLSVFEIFVPLSWGGRVVMAENALSLPQWLGQENITLVNTVPSAMAELVRIKGVPSSVRVVNLAGEALQRNLVEQIYGLGSIQRIFNLYGPSEDTTYSTYACASRRDSAVNVSIGKPISNTRAYVLDQGMRLVPVGARGELWLAGAGLARGYLNQPALTAERFLPNLFSLTGGERLYRTGDLVRWTQEGTLEFLGRLDHQIKLRGYRIEMGEIEATLLGCPGVEHAVVLVRPGGNTTRLVAYVVFQKPRLSVTMVDLRNQLKKKLPEYMVPTAWVELEQLPLTVNGKVDRKSLPAPQIGHEELGDQAVSSTAVEELLLGIWQQVLGCERISVQDNFFQLGGHSLLVTQMLARVRSTFGVDLPLRRVFEDGQTISALAQLVEEQLRSGKQRTGSPDIKPAPQTAKARLSYAQQRLWFLDRLSPDNPFYNIAARVQLKGELHKNALRQSLKEVVQRHHALRTKIETSEGQPMQIVMTADEWDLQEVDLTNLGPRQSRELETLAETEARHPFRLEKGALLRATLVTVGTAEHVLLITMHHIVSDGWSLGLLVEEVSSLYQQIVNGQSMQLPELPVQYTDYALWQREWMEGDILQEQLGYWCKQLAGIEPLELPLDHERPVMPSYRGGQIIRQFSPELAAGLKNLGRNSDVTLFMVLLAGYQIMLQRYTGRSDLVIGTPVANRTRPELERLIGFFVNMLVLRTSLDPDLAVANLLTRIRGVCLDAYAHQDLPFEKLVEELAPERDISRNPLFQVVLALQNAPARILHLQGLEVTVHPANTQSSRFDLTLLMEEAEGALKAGLDYNADIFEPNTVERMLGHFEAVLQGMVDDPHCLIQDLPMLSQSERLQLLIDWNSAASGHELCIPELFAQQAKRFGTAIALVCGENRMTYEQLDLQSNRVANYLRSFGVAPEVSVGILLQRSIETIVAILGILKAGGAYVPLDPAYPDEHLQLLIKDANVRALITASHLDKPAFQQSQAMVLNLNLEKDAIHKQNATAPAVPLSPENLAYVMYTSGSTGIPKGVAVTHRGVVRLVHHANYVHFGPEEVVLHVAPLAFDASTFEIWGSLLNGGRLAILPSEHPSLEELTATIQSCGVTTAFLTAGLFHLIADRSMPTIQTMQQLLAGGDVVSASHVQRFLAAADGATFVNGYGPTENTTFTACYRVQDPAAVPAPLPIGKPLNQTQVYVLDPQMQLVPVGAIGELYTGGSGLARGYVGQPQLTAEKFVPNPFSSIPGTRLYRTGDLVRYRTDGNLDFLGRADHQVKVRGHRIELGGIEAVLRQQEGVQDCVVTVRGDGSDKRLIAYVVPDFGQDVATANRPGRESWQTALKRKLPEFMVPVAWIELESLPLTPNGKIDRKALPEPGRIETEYIAPRTPLEETLAAIWAEVLKVDKPGIKDNFFDLGGHSLLATQIISRVRETFHVDVPVRNLFEAPTIENLSKCVSSLPRVDSQESDLHAISRETYQGLQPDEVPEVLPN
ncbi:MAG TPA: amino acid adenylation domain-containing protein [Candidatus Angelobacter sp.]|nr:amino acid adenylation domain-containing protein [Candidatus Angelobacter sp.]